MNCENLISILKAVSNDSDKNNVLTNLFPEMQIIKWSDLFLIIECYSSDKHKFEAVEIVCNGANSKEIIDDHEKYCQKLADVIPEEKYYLKAAEILDLDEKFVQQYKPAKKPTHPNISGSLYPDINGGEVFLISSRTSFAEGKLFEVKTYSDGTTETIIY